MLKFTILIIFLITLTATIATWQIQLPTVPPKAASADVWELPELPQADKVQASHAKLRSLNPWKGNEETPAKPATAGAPETAPKTGEAPKPAAPVADWQLVGIVQQGEQRYILVLDKADKVTQYSVTKSLPNGATLSRIHDDFIEISKQGKMEEVRLYDFK